MPASAASRMSEPPLKGDDEDGGGTASPASVDAFHFLLLILLRFQSLSLPLSLSNFLRTLTMFKAEVGPSFPSNFAESVYLSEDFSSSLVYLSDYITYSAAIVDARRVQMELSAQQAGVVCAAVVP